MLKGVEALSDTDLRRLAVSYAELLHGLRIPTGDPLLVLPNAEFFPDRFTHDGPSVERLAARMQGYAGLEDVSIELELAGEPPLMEAAGCGTGGCGSGACATPQASEASLPRLERSAERWLLRVPAAELKDPILLTARLATSLGAVALAERHPEGLAHAANPESAEVAAVALGFGVLLLEASYVYRKGCGGPSVGCGTVLGLSELAVVFALSLAREKHSLGKALGELATTQRALLKDAVTLVAESPSLVRLLREDPARAARGDFRLRDKGPFWSRLFGRRDRPKSKQARLDAALSALERGASVDELADLVGPADGE
ncbi:MAG TPA: hypothetical protein VNN72_25560 [Polyangiaceae bacterium]|nr:hypothetical protein [Polyangiaceae bacterium]